MSTFGITLMLKHFQHSYPKILNLTDGIKRGYPAILDSIILHTVGSMAKPFFNVMFDLAVDRVLQFGLEMDCV